MHRVVAYAIFSTRRQEEITRQEMADVDLEHNRLLVRDMKHPCKKIGNDTWCELPDEALRIVKAMGNKGRVFPYTTDAIGAAFTRACQFLGIEDLHFHDLRHDGISRLFEMGKTIPQAASVSGHKSWQSLQRYAHLKQTGDKYAGWKWLNVVTKHSELLILFCGQQTLLGFPILWMRMFCQGPVRAIHFVKIEPPLPKMGRQLAIKPLSSFFTVCCRDHVPRFHAFDHFRPSHELSL